MFHTCTDRSYSMDTIVINAGGDPCSGLAPIYVDNSSLGLLELAILVSKRTLFKYTKSDNMPFYVIRASVKLYPAGN